MIMKIMMMMMMIIITKGGVDDAGERRLAGLPVEAPI